MFCLGMIPTINKPRHVTTQAHSTSDHIITNSLMHTGFTSGIMKTDISLINFEIFCVISILPKRKMLRRNSYINADSSIRNLSAGTLKIRLPDINRSKVSQCRNANEV